MRHIQLPFICPGCGRQGFTPEVTSDEASALARGELHLRCPTCSVLLSIQATETNVSRELSRYMLEGIFVQEVLLEHILKNGKQSLESQIFNAIDTIVQDKLSPFTRRKLARRLVKMITHVIQEEFSQIADTHFTGSFSEMRQNIAQECRMNMKNTTRTQRLFDTINTVVHETLTHEEKEALRDMIGDMIPQWYHKTVDTILTK